MKENNHVRVININNNLDQNCENDLILELNYCRNLISSDVGRGTRIDLSSPLLIDSLRSRLNMFSPLNSIVEPIKKSDHWDCISRDSIIYLVKNHIELEIFNLRLKTYHKINLDTNHFQAVRILPISNDRCFIFYSNIYKYDNKGYFINHANVKYFDRKFVKKYETISIYGSMLVTYSSGITSKLNIVKL
jgi:hypothetical protein